MGSSMLIWTVLLVGWSSTATAQPAECGSIPESAQVSEVGAFSNVRYTDEHAYGFSIMLWRAGGCLFGLLESSQGLAGDAPIGVLQDLEYDIKNGHLSFSAKLTTGMVTVRGSNDLVPSRDLFAFDGALQGNAASGVMTYALENDATFAQTRSDIVLRRSGPATELMQGSKTYGEWVRTWRPILQRRGPKW